jgi:hypothetical protein
LGDEGGYQISRSVRLRSSASAYLNRTPASAGNQRTWTWSGWVKRGVLGGVQNTLFASTTGATDATYFQMAFGTVNPDCLLINSYNITTLGMQTAAVFRDPSAWYHIVFALDTTQATASNRMKLYVNGVQQTSFLTYANYPTLNSTFAINSAAAHNIGASNATSPFDGYLTEVNFIDGQALTPSSFGETDAVTGVWKPKKYAGTYGTNGFYLNFSDNSTAAALGTDFSGNGNTWTVNNISVTAGATFDSMIDVPTPYDDGGNGRGNYAVLNPLLSAGGTTANGNLQVTTATGVGHSRATIAMPASGKWYAEFIAVSAATSTDYIFGIVGADTAEASYGYNQTPSYSYTAFGERVVNGTFTASFYSSYTTGDVIGCAVNLDANEITWYKNGTAQTAISITNGSYFWIVSDASGARQITAAFNAGQRPFTYTPPAGFKALNTQNLPAPTISNGANYMAATLYTGTGSALTVANTVGSASFQPDLVWVKGRSGATDHAWYDAVRGVQKQLESNTTTAETTETTGLTAFGSTGFTVGALAQMNTSAATYVAWQWNAGGSTVTNTSGSISAQVRANPTAGFSIVTYTGTGANATVGHGLGVALSMLIVKGRDATADNWRVWHKNLTSAAYTLGLNQTIAQTDIAGAQPWNDTAPTSTVFSIGTDSSVNQNTKTFVAYCFAAVAGYSAFGSYTGNGSADGPFVYLGFRPRWVMIKNTSTAGTDWMMYDSARNSYNLVAQVLNPNLSTAEATATSAVLDFLSSGFKLRGVGTNVNASGGTYIFAAFAEVPFRSALAR